MSKNTAIICETNPFHRGHKYLFDTVRAQNDGICIAILSGNFVQRGLPGVLDKYKRTAILLENGADLVVELPYPWCIGGGEAFAAGGVAVASGLLADVLSFGSESGDMGMLTTAAAWLDTPACAEQMRQIEAEEPGIGAAVLHERLLEAHGIALSPNDKLAVWYLRQITAQHSALCPQAIHRTPHTDRVISASKIRQLLLAGEDITPYVPEGVAELYKSETFTDTKRFCDIAWLYYRQFAPETMEGDDSGLHRRLRKAAVGCVDGEDFFQKAATKKYTDARLRRTALLAMTDTPSPDTIGLPRYTILLGMNERGQAYLHTLRKRAGIAILTKPAHEKKLPPDAKVQYQWQQRADRLYTLCHTPVEAGDTYLRRSPVMLPL